MLKTDFLKQMHLFLRGMPEDEINDILYDYEEHFALGVQDGRSEDEIAESLGDPKSIAKQLRAEYMLKVAKASPNLRNMSNAVLATIGLSFFRVIGFSFIAAGVLLLLDQLGLLKLTWGQIWPIFILCPGLAFEMSYFSNPMKGKANLSLLIPGGILTIVGILFFFIVFTDYAYLAILWPIFILAAAFGLFQFYIFGDRNGWFLLPIFALTSVGVIFLVKNLVSGNVFSIFLGIFLIVIGCFVAFNKRRKMFGK